MSSFLLGSRIESVRLFFKNFTMAKHFNTAVTSITVAPVIKVMSLFKRQGVLRRSLQLYNRSNQRYR